MPKNRLEDLRNHLFEVIEALKDKEEPMDIDRALAVAEVAREVISSAKLEVQFIQVTGKEVEDSSSAFITSEKQIGTGQTNVARRP